MLVKKSILALFSIAALATFSFAQSQPKLTFTGKYPIPLGEFSSIRLVPQAEIPCGDTNEPACPQPYGSLGDPCNRPGNLFFNSDENMLYVCHRYLNTPDTLTWGFLPGVWRMDGSNIFLSDDTDPELKRVSITPLVDSAGNDIAPFKLSLGNSAGIIAKGTIDSNASGILTNTPSPGDTRFMWFPEKGSFFAGGIPESAFITKTAPAPVGNTLLGELNNNWSAGNIGLYSVNFGMANKTTGTASSALGGVNNYIEETSGYSTIIGGSLNSIDLASFTSVSGGRRTLISQAPISVNLGNNSTIKGVNTAASPYIYSNVIILGNSTIYNNSYSFIGGDAGGTAQIGVDAGTFEKSNYAAILNADGLINTDTAYVSSAAPATGNSCQFCFIGTGQNHKIQGHSEYSAIAGGKNNSILFAKHSIIMGGELNTIRGNIPDIKNNPKVFNTVIEYASIGGGKGNSALSSHSTVLGGENNIAGSYLNQAVQPTHATVGGGKNNYAFGAYSFIGSGQNNRIGSCYGFNATKNLCLSPIKGDPAKDDGKYSVIGSGKNNTILADYAYIGTGEHNTIGPGGDYSVIETGKNVDLNGSHSWAGGRNIRVQDHRVFIWGYKSDEDANTNDTDPSNDDPIRAYLSDSFIFYNHMSPMFGIEEIKVGIKKTDPEYTLDVAGNIRSTGLIITGLGEYDSGPVCRDPITGQLGCCGYCDLAEVFNASEAVSPGDVLVVDTAAESLKLKKSISPYDKKVVGVVSKTPAITFEGARLLGHGPAVPDNTTRPPVALSGRVPCKVSLENGTIGKGDLLTTASIPGHAMKATDEQKSFGTIIGKALEPFNESIAKGEKTGEITVFISLQ